ncbi:hypothetical protein BZG14_11525 [Salinivibrio sp. IB282]|nr:hypothetical protein BZG14_11525 [Salinivibrio sp. IB282]
MPQGDLPKSLALVAISWRYQPSFGVICQWLEHKTKPLLYGEAVFYLGGEDDKNNNCEVTGILVILGGTKHHGYKPEWSN